MKFDELRQKTEAELNKLLKDLRETLRQIRFKTASNKLKNVREVRQTKKDIARILTLLKQKKS